MEVSNVGMIPSVDRTDVHPKHVTDGSGKICHSLSNDKNPQLSLGGNPRGIEPPSVRQYISINVRDHLGILNDLVVI